MSGYSSGYLQCMTSKSLSRYTRLNIFLRLRNTAALEGTWCFDCKTMVYFFSRQVYGLDDEVHALVNSYCPVEREEVGGDF